jgi:hypothetical protein
MDRQSGSRALDAVSDLVDLLRLAQSSTERLAQEVSGVPYEHAGLIERELQRIRRSAEKLRSMVAEESGSIERGQPRRRASDTRHN